MIDNTGRDELFLSGLRCSMNPEAFARLRTVQRGIDYDASLQGYWIRRGSTAHSLANLLGIPLYDPRVGPRSQQNPWQHVDNAE